MIIQIGTDVDESRILWRHKESDEWKRADIDDLIRAYEDSERTGEWAVAYLDHESIGARPKTLYCSECNWITSFPSAWCPNCGAKME